MPPGLQLSLESKRSGGGRRRRGRGGFTLAEILVVVVIMGLMSAIIVPRIASRDDQKATTAARVMISDLLYAQNRAIVTQTVQYVQFNTASGYYQVLDAMSPAHVIANPVDGSTYQVNLGSAATNALSQATLRTASFDGQSVLAFDSLGVPYSYNTSTAVKTALVSGSVSVQSGQRTVTVNVAPFSGEVTVQ